MSLRDKYDIDHPWVDSCVVCGEPVVMTAARWEVLGTYHDGCFGYPACSCADSHQGECDAPFNVIKLRRVPAPAKDLGTDAQVLPFQLKGGSTLWTSSSSGPLTLEMMQKALEAMVSYVPPTTEEFLRAVSPALYETYMKYLSSPPRRYLRLVPGKEEK